MVLTDRFAIFAGEPCGRSGAGNKELVGLEPNPPVRRRPLQGRPEFQRAGAWAPPPSEGGPECVTQ